MTAFNLQPAIPGRYMSSFYTVKPGQEFLRLSLARVFHCGLAAWSPFCCEACRLGSAVQSHSPDCTRTEAAEWVSRTMVCVCVCLDFSFILIYNPTGDLVSSRIQGMDDCTVGSAFNGLFFFFFIGLHDRKQQKQLFDIHP